MTHKSEWAHKPYEINWAQVQELGKPKSWKWCILQTHIKKRSLNQTFVAQVGVSSKPCYETLTLVSRCFNTRVVLKALHLLHGSADMVIVLRAPLQVQGKVLNESKNHVEKIIGRKVGINLHQKTFWKKCDYKKLTAKISKSNI